MSTLQQHPGLPYLRISAVLESRIYGATFRPIGWLQELQVLGKGAYGLAVAVVNRLDGRQYVLLARA